MHAAAAPQRLTLARARARSHPDVCKVRLGGGHFLGELDDGHERRALQEGKHERGACTTGGQRGRRAHVCQMRAQGDKRMSG
jgi:hypothetical protein